MHPLDRTFLFYLAAFMVGLVACGCVVGSALAGGGPVVDSAPAIYTCRMVGPTPGMIEAGRLYAISGSPLAGRRMGLRNAR